MITPTMTDDEKRKSLMDMAYDDLEAEIVSGRLTWLEFDRLLPEIGAAIGATVMFEESINKQDATKPIRPPVYGMPETSAPYQPPSKPTAHTPPERLELQKAEPDDSELEIASGLVRMIEAIESRFTIYSK